MPRSSGGGSHSSGHRSSSGSSRSCSSGGGSHSSGYRSSSGSSHSYSSGGGRSSGYRSSSGSSHSFSGGWSHSSGFGSSSGSSHSSGSGWNYNTGYNSTGSSAYSPVSRPKQKSRRAAQVSESNFTGARKYVTYQNNRPRYIYSDYGSNAGRKPWRLLFWVPIVLLFAFGLYAALQPAALTMDYDNTVYIADTLKIIEDPDSLFTAMEDFRDVTGITPFLVTLSNESWNRAYEDLYSFVFDLYVNEFEDEKHWLLVYTEPASPDPAFSNWYWEGVQGDDTVNILTEQAADDFGIALQKYLTSKRYSVGQAFTMAFSETTPVILSKASVDIYEVFAAVLVMGGILWLAIRRTGLLVRKPERPESLPADARPVQSNAKEINCEYCGGVYLTDSFNCPHCGAGRQAMP